MNELEKVRIWNNLKEKLKLIYDNKTRQMYYKALLVRAINNWGFNPDKPADQVNEIELDDWEQEFVESINDFKMFGIDTRKEKREQTHKEALNRMKNFIIKGGQRADIPEDIKVASLYFEALFSLGDDILNEADNLLKG